MKTSVVGYPRIGSQRELKFAIEQYFNHKSSQNNILQTASALRKTHWLKQTENHINYIASNDFSFYDTVLDTAVLLNIIPDRYRQLRLSPLDQYFAMARGYQGDAGDVKALAMKKWFNTNYHYMVPEIDDATDIQLAGSKPFDEYTEARSIGIETKPVIVGAFTLLKLSHYAGQKRAEDYIDATAEAYRTLLHKFSVRGAAWVQLDEPSLVMDLSDTDKALFNALYRKILSDKPTVHVLLQTYFGDVRDCYNDIMSLPFDGVGLDFIEGKQTLALIEQNGFPSDKTLFAGLVNGKNIWRNNYAETLKTISQLQNHCQSIVLSTSCSLLHVPYTLANEEALSQEHRKHFAFAQEKLFELLVLSDILSSSTPSEHAEYLQNVQLFSKSRTGGDPTVRRTVASLIENDFTRTPSFDDRAALQKQALNLPLFPTTTIGSFPQTADIKSARSRHKKDELSLSDYQTFIRRKITECVSLQEDIGLDVLVHGEFERNDMVEYFGESLHGFLFTQKAWVQSYGTRCVKPPIIWGDVSRSKPITVDWSVYAQSLTKKPMKGMLTGPVTILNWSFPREDISLKDCAYQIGLAIRDEALDLESHGIRIIQVDEAALREKLPLRKSDWHNEYLDWAIPAFRLVHSAMKAETQIHTHMCYSEFADIIRDIDAMDADVITFEASRSDLAILDVLKQNNFRTETGPGVYDIHSPRVPSTYEIKEAVRKMLLSVPKQKLWINPDCGLKTRGETETIQSLKNLVEAAKEIRDENS